MKIQNVRNVLKKWNKEVLGDIFKGVCTKNGGEDYDATRMG